MSALEETVLKKRNCEEKVKPNDGHKPLTSTVGVPSVRVGHTVARHDRALTFRKLGMTSSHSERLPLAETNSKALRLNMARFTSKVRVFSEVFKPSEATRK